MNALEKVLKNHLGEKEEENIKTFITHINETLKHVGKWNGKPFKQFKTDLECMIEDFFADLKILEHKKKSASLIDVEAEEDKEPDEETQKGFETDEIEDEEDDEETPQKLNQTIGVKRPSPYYNPVVAEVVEPRKIKKEYNKPSKQISLELIQEIRRCTEEELEHKMKNWEIEQLKEKTEKQQEEIERLKNVITKKQQYIETKLNKKYYY